MSLAAKAYSLGARRWMESLLPYGTAQYVELLLFAVLPILAIAIIVLA